MKAYWYTGLSYKFFSLLAALFLILPLINPLRAQDLEPRFLSPAPVGINFILVSYSYSTGNIVLDQSLPLEGVEADMHSAMVAYARSIDFFGFSGRVSVAMPFATCTWRGELYGIDTSTVRNGLGDPLIAFSFNFLGSPALDAEKFRGYQSHTIMGFSLKVRAPLGQYNEKKFFNLGTGRWQFNPRLGIARSYKRFVLEGYADAWFFTTNDNFYNGNTLEQKPMFALQAHLIYQIRRGFWGSISYGQSYGGETRLNGVANKNDQNNNRLGAALAFPIGTTQSIKVIYTSGMSTRVGADFDTIVLGWQYLWGG